MGYVYVIGENIPEEGPNGRLTNIEFVKIGYTSDENIFNRMGQLQTGNPRELQVIYVYEFPSPEMAKQVERLCHWRLQNWRLKGEWFTYCDQVATVLERLEALGDFQSHTCPDEEAYAACSARVEALHG